MQKLDRRVQRTRGLLQAAIRELVIERGYDSLTIQDITDHANLRRATFYMHYRDKQELLLSALTDTFTSLFEQTRQFAHDDDLGGKTRLEAYLVTFQHVQQNHALYRNILMSGSGMVFMRKVRDFIAELIVAGLKDHDSLPIAADLVANYVAGAELSMIIWWLEHDMPYPVEVMARAVQALTLDGVKHVMEMSLAEDAAHPNV
ncbi:MAG TPA: TetR/AcrR family transcriptional regulator [Aggregatilineales bacterium]|nr:TetR/AcrR family transcriptional regulator [Aggregatilineales bacterium]